MPMQAFGADSRMSLSSWERLGAPADTREEFLSDVLVELCVMVNVAAWLD